MQNSPVNPAMFKLAKKKAETGYAKKSPVGGKVGAVVPDKYRMPAPAKKGPEAYQMPAKRVSPKSDPKRSQLPSKRY